MLSAADAFQRDGVVRLEGVISPAWIEILRAGVERNLAAPSPYAKGYGTGEGPGRFFGDYCSWRRIPEYEKFLLEGPAAALAAELMGSSCARLFHEHVLVKEPGTPEATPWHHDLPYYCVEGTQFCSLWIPLDPVEEGVCPRFIRGSHRWGKRFGPILFTNKPYEHDDPTLEPMPDIDAAPEDYDIVAWSLEPGDLIAFDFLTVHGAPGNESGNRRRGFAARWLGDDAVYAERRLEVSPPFPEIVGKLPDGAALPADLFPQVWPTA